MGQKPLNDIGRDLVENVADIPLGSPLVGAAPYIAKVGEKGMEAADAIVRTVKKYLPAKTPTRKPDVNLPLEGRRARKPTSSRSMRKR